MANYNSSIYAFMRKQMPLVYELCVCFLCVLGVMWLNVGVSAFLWLNIAVA